MRQPNTPLSPALSEPVPESEPIIVTEVRGEGPYAAHPATTTPQPESDPDVVSKSRGEDVLELGHASASLPLPEPKEGSISHARGENPFAMFGGGEEHRETSVRGEDTHGEETRARGENPARAIYGAGGDTGTFSRGEDDFDAAYVADFDASFDDPADMRRITVLGALAARQQVVKI